MSQVTSFDLYERYLVPSLHSPAAQELVRMAQPQCGDRVLDVACGTGIVARVVAPIIGRSGEITGLDISPDMLAIARSLPKPEGAEITFMEGSAQAMRLEKHTFDLVLCQQGLQFMPDRQRAMRELFRVLVPGGRAVISVNQSLANNRLFAQFNDVLTRLVGVPALAQPFSLGDAAALKLLFTQAGFHNVVVKPVTVTVRFNDERTFITAIMMGSGAVVSAFKDMEADKRNAMIPVIYNEMEKVLAFYRQDEEIVFSLALHIGVGVA